MKSELGRECTKTKRFSGHFRLSTFAFFLGWAGLAGPAMAQPYPAKPVRILVGFAPGGGTDIMARAAARRATKRRLVL